MEQVYLDPVASITEEVIPGGAAPVRLRLQGAARSLSSALYAPYDASASTQESRITFTAIPYQAWGNRGEGAMRIWIPTT